MLNSAHFLPAIPTITQISDCRSKTQLTPYVIKLKKETKKNSSKNSNQKCHHESGFPQTFIHLNWFDEGFRIALL